MGQGRQSPVIRWRADDECEDWPSGPEHPSRSVLGAASADRLRGDGGRYSPTNLGFILEGIKVVGGGARRKPESNSRHHQIAVQPPVRRGTDLDLDSSQPAYKRSRY